MGHLTSDNLIIEVVVHNRFVVIDFYFSTRRTSIREFKNPIIDDELGQF